MAYAIFNHELVTENEISISPHDRGFRYGDGIFETLIVKNGKIYQFEWHMDRLQRGLQVIRINFDISPLSHLCRQLLKANNFTDGLLRIQLTRGIGGRGYQPDAKAEPTLIIETIASPLQKTLVSLWKSSYEKISPTALPVQFKLSQGLNSTLSRLEASENACFDALMLNHKGEICETSSANIFWMKEGALYTPALACGVLEGSIRAAIIRLWQGKLYEVAETIETLRGAEAVFITNSAWLAVAVGELKPLAIKWESSTITSQILALLEKDINNLSK